MHCMIMEKDRKKEVKVVAVKYTLEFIKEAAIEFQNELTLMLNEGFKIEHISTNMDMKEVNYKDSLIVYTAVLIKAGRD